MMRTKSIIVSAIFFLAMSFTLQAQNRIFQKGQIDAQIGVGVIPTYFMDDAKTQILPLSANVDYYFHNKFSIGLIVGHASYETKPQIEGDGILVQRKNTTTVIGLRPTIHVTQIDNWDFYGGFQLSRNFSKIDSNASQEHDDFQGITSEKNNFTYTGFVGAKYAFAKKVHAFTEVGFDISLVKVGIGIQL